MAALKLNRKSPARFGTDYCQNQALARRARRGKTSSKTRAVPARRLSTWFCCSAADSQAPPNTSWYSN